MVSVVAPTDPTRPGARARVQIRPPYAGEAQIVVATDRVIETRTVRVGGDGDDDRSAGDGGVGFGRLRARHGDDAARSGEPAGAAPRDWRGLRAGRYGQSHAAGGSGRGPAERAAAHDASNVPVQVRNAPGGERVRVAIAMVDEGILNITRYESPNPVDYFFGRRALGVDVRDDYGRLLNPNLGAPATARQGGDSLGGEGLTVVPTRTVAIVSDIVEVRGGRAMIPVEIPDFNGTLRLMAVAWSETRCRAGR